MCTYAPVTKIEKEIKTEKTEALLEKLVNGGFAVKNFEAAVAEGDTKKAESLFSEATKKIDQACTKGVIVKNTASRKKSNLAKKLNAMKK